VGCVWLSFGVDTATHDSLRSQRHRLFGQREHLFDIRQLILSYDRIHFTTDGASIRTTRYPTKFTTAHNFHTLYGHMALFGASDTHDDIMFGFLWKAGVQHGLETDDTPQHKGGFVFTWEKWTLDIDFIHEIPS
jgi:hypothetical protein